MATNLDKIDALIEEDVRNAEKKALEPEVVKEKKVKLVNSGFKKGKDFTLDEKTGVIYLGRAPMGFMEPQMREYFSQFGDVYRLKMPRSKKTGKPRGYAFIEFESPEVAKIVADTMNGYMMYGKVLQSHVVPFEKLHPDLWRQRKIFRDLRPARRAAHKAAYDQESTKVVSSKLFSKTLRREKKVNQKLKDLGIDYEFGGWSADADKDALLGEAKENFDKRKKAFVARKEAKRVADEEAKKLIQEEREAFLKEKEAKIAAKKAARFAKVAASREAKKNERKAKAIEVKELLKAQAEEAQKEAAKKEEAKKEEPKTEEVKKEDKPVKEKSKKIKATEPEVKAVKKMKKVKKSA